VEVALIWLPPRSPTESGPAVRSRPPWAVLRAMPLFLCFVGAWSPLICPLPALLIILNMDLRSYRFGGGHRVRGACVVVGAHRSL